jgi:hypothetical protein
VYVRFSGNIGQTINVGRKMTAKKTKSFWLRDDPRPNHDIVRLRAPRLGKGRGKRFETENDVVRESKRSESVLGKVKNGGAELPEFLRECRKGCYICEKPYCPICARKFRRWFIGELLRITEQKATIYLLTVLIKGVDRENISDLDPNKGRDLLRQHLRRANLEKTPVIGGVEIVYRAKEKRWILHANLVVIGGNPDAIEKFKASFSNSELKRPTQQAELNDRPKQLSYILKFTTYHRPLGQATQEKGPAKPLNAPEHYALVNWMSQLEFKDFLLLHRARRSGDRIELNEASD